MCLFRPGHALNSKYLLYLLNGPIGREQAIRAAVGAAHPHINLTDIKAYKIPCPSLAIQKSVVGEFEALAEHTNRLQAIHQQKLTALDELKKSLLHQAFTGEL
jgi:type I restriction enzyme S subunit